MTKYLRNQFDYLSPLAAKRRLAFQGERGRPGRYGDIIALRGSPWLQIEHYHWLPNTSHGRATIPALCKA
jgi:hypothetical protein